MVTAGTKSPSSRECPSVPNGKAWVFSINFISIPQHWARGVCPSIVLALSHVC
jgi:hypothetical protein